MRHWLLKGPISCGGRYAHAIHYCIAVLCSTKSTVLSMHGALHAVSALWVQLGKSVSEPALPSWLLQPAGLHVSAAGVPAPHAPADEELG